MIAGVPIFAVIYAGVKALTNKKLRKKDLPTETTSYMTVGKLEENDAFTEYVPETRKKHTTRKKNRKKLLSKKLQIRKLSKEEIIEKETVEEKDGEYLI